MKMILLAGVGLIALGMATPASAADMAVKARHHRRWWLQFTTGAASISARNGGWAWSHNCLEYRSLGRSRRLR